MPQLWLREPRTMAHPGARLYYDRATTYAANVLDLDGYSLEFVYKSWQH